MGTPDLTGRAISLGSHEKACHAEYENAQDADIIPNDALHVVRRIVQGIFHGSIIETKSRRIYLTS